MAQEILRGVATAQDEINQNGGIKGQKLQADYVVNTANKTKIAFCYDSQSPDTVSFKDEFFAAFVSKKWQLVPTVCDLSAFNFNPATVVNEAISNGADGLFVVSHIDRLDTAINVAKAN